MRKVICIAALSALLAFGASGARGQGTVPQRPPIDFSILHAQVILDRLGFSPGVLDGRDSRRFAAALRAFQATRGLVPSGTLDPATLGALHPHRAWRPFRSIEVPIDALRGRFIRTIPKDLEAQAKLPALAYTRPLEKLAEMFHTTPEVLVELNPGGGTIERGAVFRFPDVLPAARAYPGDLPVEWRRTLGDLSVDSSQPRAERIVVDQSEDVLKVYAPGDLLVAQFPATMGSAHDPLPIGTWKIVVEDYNPEFRYNPDLFWDADPTHEGALIPPGPNGPVGVIWLDLSKPHYGIHGTPEPQNVGVTQSHGCIRLTNWDAARLSLMVAPGTVAVFQP